MTRDDHEAVDLVRQKYIKMIFRAEMHFSSNVVVAPKVGFCPKSHFGSATV
jgi:hypothetical protein